MAVLSVEKNMLEEFDSKGYILLQGVIPDKQIDELTNAIESFRDTNKSALLPGFRNLQKQEQIAAFAHSKRVKEIVQTFLSPKAIPVRSVFFDKTPASNWYVTWHQDLSIAVEKRIETEGYGPWSTKEGTLHVQPPEEILDQIISLRIHLDACPKENGAIKFISGSHKLGRIPDSEISKVVSNSQPQVCEAARGDIIVMRPLILHSSSKSESPDHRRVLHLEFSSATLPNGLEWTEA